MEVYDRENERMILLFKSTDKQKIKAFTAHTIEQKKKKFEITNQTFRLWEENDFLVIDYGSWDNFICIKNMTAHDYLN